MPSKHNPDYYSANSGESDLIHRAALRIASSFVMSRDMILPTMHCTAAAETDLRVRENSGTLEGGRSVHVGGNPRKKETEKRKNLTPGINKRRFGVRATTSRCR